MSSSSLISALKDAQSAANYNDYKAGLIPEQEYEKLKGSSFVSSPSEKVRIKER